MNHFLSKRSKFCKVRNIRLCSNFTSMSAQSSWVPLAEDMDEKYLNQNRPFIKNNEPGRFTFLFQSFSAQQHIDRISYSHRYIKTVVPVIISWVPGCTRGICSFHVLIHNISSFQNLKRCIYKIKRKPMEKLFKI